MASAVYRIQLRKPACDISGDANDSPSYRAAIPYQHIPMRSSHAPVTAFESRVLSIVRRIPPGCVASYGEVAALAGRPGAARAVGNIMRGCSRPDVPCHRVIAAGGRLGGYGGSESLKRALLMAEGISVRGSRLLDLDRIRFKGRQPARTRRLVKKKK
jgi:O-6-methylguanine DNA methyltransferase